MLRLRGIVAAAGLTMGWLAGAVTAAPPVLDRVPDNALVVVAASSPDSMQRNLQALVTATEMPFLPMVPKLEDLLAGAGITQGLDTGKSVALVIFAPPAEKLNAKADGKPEANEDGDMNDDGKSDKDEPVVVLLPITGYEALLKNFEVKPSGGIDQVMMPDGKENFLRDVGGGYAAMSPNRELLAKFEAKSGGAAIKSKLGKAGDRLSDSFDLVTIVNMDAVRPLWPEIKKQMSQKIKEQAENLPIPGEAPDPMDNPAVVWLSDSVVRDGRALVGGVKAGTTGVNFDFAVNFTEGTSMAKMFAGGSKAGSLLSKLPSASYLFAGAFDFSKPELKTFFKELIAKGADMGKALGMAGGAKRIDTTDGAAVLVGVPAGGIFGGLTTSTISYTASKDVAGLMAAQKADLIALNGTTEEAVTMESTYKDASTKVDDVDVDEYSVKLKLDPDSEAGEMGPQAINAIFGPTGGPAGYIAKADGGVYQTFGKNSDLLSKAMKTGKGGDNLSSDKMMSQVGESMPSARIAEAYIGMKGLLDLIVPAAAMFTGVQIPAEDIPESLPPIGAAISGNDGAAHFAIFVPSPVIKTAVKLVMTVQQQMGDGFGGGEGEEAPADQPEKKDGKPGTGQPRF